MIDIAVVEDEADEQKKLRSFLADYSAHTGERFTVSFFASGADFLSSAGCASFDLALVDIILGKDKPNGIEIARQWRSVNPDALLIFITNLVQYALKSYALDALNYIVKPVEYSTFAQKLSRAVELIHLRQQKKICFNSKNGVECLNKDEICYIETYGRCLKIHTTGQAFYCTETLKNMEDRLPKNSFFRCHKAILVNLLHVSSIHENSVTVGGDEVPVSRHRKKEFMDALVNCFGGAVS